MTCAECADCASALRNGTIEVDWASGSVYFACWACNEITMRLIGTVPTDCEYCRQMAMALAKCKVGVHNGGRITVRCANCLTVHTIDLFQDDIEHQRNVEEQGVRGILTEAMADAATGRQTIEDERVVCAFTSFMALLDAAQIRDIATWIADKGADSINRSAPVGSGHIASLLNELVPLLWGAEKKSLRAWARNYLGFRSSTERRKPNDK